MTFFRIKRNGETLYFKTMNDLKKVSMGQQGNR